MNKIYTIEQVKTIVFLACSQQKAADYQKAGSLLIVDREELEDNSIKLLDWLCQSDKDLTEITISDINDELFGDDIDYKEEDLTDDELGLTQM